MHLYTRFALHLKHPPRDLGPLRGFGIGISCAYLLDSIATCFSTPKEEVICLDYRKWGMIQTNILMLSMKLGSKKLVHRQNVLKTYNKWYLGP